MTDALDRLARLLEEVPARLAGLSEEEAPRPRAGGKWSPKQIVGHLIDSASNNHQRWVRGMAAPQTAFPKYEQESWVESQGYAGERWADLACLWLFYNRHLLHLARGMTAEQAAHLCAVGDKAPVTLAALVEDYLVHLEKHLAQIG